MQEERARYERLVNHALIGVFELREGHFTYVNRHLLDISGYSEQELLGHTPEEFVVPEDREKLIARLGERMQGRTAVVPTTYTFRKKDGSMLEAQVNTHFIETAAGALVEGTLCDITLERRLARLHRTVLELGETILTEGETILTEGDIDRILQLVLDAITEHSGFKRAVVSLYDLSLPDPFEGKVYRILASGLSSEELGELKAFGGMGPEERRMAFTDRFRLGAAYYIPHDQVPWNAERGISGTVTIEGWHKDDFLFIPLQGETGIIGHISVDDPIDRSAPTVESIEPVASLANFAALAVERTYKLRQLHRQKERLHGLSKFGRQLSQATHIDVLCEMAAARLRDDMDYDFCAIWLREGPNLLLHGIAAKGVFPDTELPKKGSRIPLAGKGLARWVIQHGEPLIIPDVRKEKRYNTVRKEVLSEADIPIVGRKGTLGVISAESRRLAAFGEQDREILTSLASQLAVAISNLTSQEDLRQQAIRDPLTGLYNRHYFNEVIEVELERADRYNHPLSLMMVDVDGFRAVNNRLGHLKGDEVLCAVARLLCEGVRASDRVIRYGGDEFLVLMPETKGESEAVARRLKEQIGKLQEALGLEGLRVGLSIGIYTHHSRDESSVEEILVEVDRRMYADKRAAHADRADEYCY